MCGCFQELVGTQGVSSAPEAQGLQTVAIMVLLGFAAFVILDIYKVWVPASGWKVYLSVIHAIPFIYYLIFRIQYRKIK